MEEQDAGLGRDRDADLVGHLEPTRALEVLVVDEREDQALELAPIGLRKHLRQRDVPVEDSRPTPEETDGSPANARASA